MNKSYEEKHVEYKRGKYQKSMMRLEKNKKIWEEIESDKPKE